MSGVLCSRQRRQRERPSPPRLLRIVPLYTVRHGALECDALQTWLIIGLVGVLAVAATVTALVGNGGDSGAREDAGPPSSTTIRGEETTAELAEDFASVHGWIAFRDGFRIVAVDPENPKDTLVLGPDTFPLAQDDPIAWSSDGTKLLLRSRLEDGPYPGLVRPPPRRLHGPSFGLGFRFRTSTTPTKVKCARLTPRGDPSRPTGQRSPLLSSGRERGPYIIDADGEARPLGCLRPRQENLGKAARTVR